MDSLGPLSMSNSSFSLGCSSRRLPQLPNVTNLTRSLTSDHIGTMYPFCANFPKFAWPNRVANT